MGRAELSMRATRVLVLLCTCLHARLTYASAGPCSGEEVVNAEAPGFYTDASHQADQSQRALWGQGTFKPGVTHVVSWFAGVPVDGRCKMRSIMFRFRYVWEVEVKVNNGGQSIAIAHKPDNQAAYQWIQSDVIELGANTVKVELELWPSMGHNDKPQLKEVRVIFCCQLDPPCENVKRNEEFPDWVFDASSNQQQAGKALLGSGPFWSPASVDIEYWNARLPDDAPCFIYAIEFEVAQAWEVFVSRSRFGVQGIFELVELSHPDDNPGGMDWWTGAIVFNSSEDQGRVQGVELEVWAGMDVTTLVHAKLRNVVLTLCCQPDPVTTTKQPRPPHDSSSSSEDDGDSSSNSGGDGDSSSSSGGDGGSSSSSGGDGDSSSSSGGDGNSSSSSGGDGDSSSSSGGDGNSSSSSGGDGDSSSSSGGDGDSSSSSGGDGDSSSSD